MRGLVSSEGEGSSDTEGEGTRGLVSSEGEGTSE